MNYIQKQLKNFDKEFNEDGCGKALVLIEDDEFGNSQKPAQNIVKDFLTQSLRGLLDEIRAKIQPVPFDDNADLSERARLREMHQLGYNQAVTDLNKIINNI